MPLNVMVPLIMSLSAFLPLNVMEPLSTFMP